MGIQARLIDLTTQEMVAKGGSIVGLQCMTVAGYTDLHRGLVRVITSNSGEKMAKPKGYEAVDKKRAFSLVVYDLQGGPIHPDVISYLEEAAYNAAQMDKSLAITTEVV